MTLRTWLLCLMVFVGLCLLANTAEAKSPCENLKRKQIKAYDEAVAAGSEQVAAGEYEAALASFEAAQTICPYDPALVYNVARTRQLMGDCQTAITLFEQAETQIKSGLAETELSADKVAQRKAEAIEECSKGEAQITCADLAVTLVVGEGGEAACPYSATLAVGSHAIKAKKEGFEDWTGTLKVQHGESNALKVPPLTAKAPDVPAEEPVVIVEPAGGFPWDWTLIGTGGALVATGVVLQVVASSQRSEVKDAKPVNGAISSMTEKEALDLQDSADTLATAGAITLGVGGALLATGVVLLLLDSGDSETPQVGFVVTPNGAIVGLGGRF